jgi:kinesin family protein 1
VPRLCEDLFDRIVKSKEQNSQTVYEVKFSMMEIYNEMVRDLCTTDQTKNKKGLRVREHPTKGFYRK